jgi:hypothetical protein
MSTPTLTLIEEQMASLIGAMSIGSGYNFNWGSVNEIDKPKWEYPAAWITLENENNIDEPDGAWSNTYLQEAFYEIMVQTRLDQEVSSPIWEIDKELNMALDDLKKLFGANYSISGRCDTIMYKGMTREFITQGDVFIPKRMITRWRIQYTQNRENPSIAFE